MSKTPKCDELDEVATCMTDDETVRAWKRLAYKLETNNTALRAEWAREFAKRGHETAKLERENAALRADKERLDWLEKYGVCSRAAIDEARAALAEEAKT